MTIRHHQIDLLSSVELKRKLVNVHSELHQSRRVHDDLALGDQDSTLVAAIPDARDTVSGIFLDHICDEVSRDSYPVELDCSGHSHSNAPPVCLSPLLRGEIFCSLRYNLCKTLFRHNLHNLVSVKTRRESAFERSAFRNMNNGAAA